MYQSLHFLLYSSIYLLGADTKVLLYGKSESSAKSYLRPLPLHIEPF
jgi:hypothetical protein